MLEKVYLEIDDEITSVIDKIKKTTSDNIEIVVPKRATLIQSIVNLKLLKRQSELLNKNITLFITDEKGINLAKKANLNIKGNEKFDQKEKKEKTDNNTYEKNKKLYPNLGVNKSLNKNNDNNFFKELLSKNKNEKKG